MWTQGRRPGDCVEVCILCGHREGGQEIVLRCVYCVATGKEARRCVEVCLLCGHMEGGQEIVFRCVYCVDTGREPRRLC